MAVLVTLMAVVLLGFGGLVTDIGRMYVVKTNLQTGMDACALAAAAQLTGDPDSLTRAVAHGLATLDESKTASGTGSRDHRFVNRVFETGPIVPSAVDVEFAPTLSGQYLSIADGAAVATTRFVRCRYAEDKVPVYLMQILNILGPSVGIPAKTTVTALAAAGLEPSSVTCAIPVGLCKAPGSTAATNFGLIPGEWKTALSRGPGKIFGPGNFGWLDFSPPGGGATELADLLTGDGYCELKKDIEVDEAGSKQSLDSSWNTRFGIYANVGPDPQAAAPDFTGVAYNPLSWPNQRDAYVNSGDYTRQLDETRNYNNPRPPSPPNTIPTGGPNGIDFANVTILTQGEHLARGKKRRIATAPIIDCSVWDDGGVARPKIEDFGCVLMLHPASTKGPNQNDPVRIEFIGLASAPGTPCASGGLAGSGAGPLVPTLVQ